MEGILHKWTNYWNGWQPRWFILEDGILSYYQSKEDVSKGSKGSIKVSVCDIGVHPTDSTRLDLTIPSEQHYYLRAGSAAERQQWLIALGCAKQTAGKTRSGRDSTAGETGADGVKTKKSELRLYCDLLMQQAHQVKTAAVHRDGPQLEQMEEATSLLGATCDTFIRTLDECMALVARASAGSPLPQLTDLGMPLHAATQKRDKRTSTSSMDYSRSNSGGS